MADCAMADSIRLRPATQGDCVALHRVQLAAIRGLPAGAKGRQGVENWLAARTPAAYAADMERERLVVADANGECVGWGAFDDARHEITNVFVDPSRQRRGIGRLIVAELERGARAAGHTQICLKATGTAIAFYAAIGYRAEPPVSDDAGWAVMIKDE